MTETLKPIALFVPSLVGGGAEKVMVMLANGFAERGHKVDLVLATTDGPFLSDVSPKVRIINLETGRVFPALWPLAQYIRREQPVALLSALNHANVIALLARHLSGRKLRVVVSEHSSPSRSLTQSPSGRVIRTLVQFFYPQADRIVCVSNGVEREMADLLGLPTQKLTTIYNPLDLDRIRALAGEPVEHPWLQPDRTSPVLLAVGRLTPAKDYPTLLRAMVHLRKQHDARLILLGQGEELAALKALSQSLALDDAVCFAGFQSNPYAWMAACDVYVMSSAWEGLPGALMEAMACGAPIVSTDCPNGPFEILEGGRWGRLVPVGDDKALAEAIATTLTQTEKLERDEKVKEFDKGISVDNYLSELNCKNALAS